MRLLAWTVEQRAVDDGALDWSDHADAVARRVDDATLDHGVFPVTAGNGIVARVKLAIDDVHVSAPAIWRAAEMDPIPATHEFHAPDIHIIAGKKEDRVIRGVDNIHIAHVESL